MPKNEPPMWSTLPPLLLRGRTPAEETGHLQKHYPQEHLRCVQQPTFTDRKPVGDLFCRLAPIKTHPNQSKPYTAPLPSCLSSTYFARATKSMASSSSKSGSSWKAPPKPSKARPLILPAAAQRKARMLGHVAIHSGHSQHSQSTCFLTQPDFGYKMLQTIRPAMSFLKVIGI